MSRPARAFTAKSFALEGRLLLTVGPASTPTNPPTVGFVTAMLDEGGGDALYGPIQVVTQNAGEATLTLSRSDTVGSLRVEVVTNPLTSSPYAGAMVGAVDQTVTFADGQSQASLTVPILAGAPNPGNVDLHLNVVPIVPTTLITYFGRNSVLDLKILASDPTVPPKVVSLDYTNQGYLLGFNKPMNPAGASDVKNYTVTSVAYGHANPVPIRTARYDPATQSVILIPKPPNPPGGGMFSSLTQVRTARTPVRRGHPSKVVGSLTDLQGNPINASTTHGKIELRDAYNPPGGSF